MPDVTAGVVGKPLGLRGEVYVHPDPDLADAFPPGAAYQAGERTLTVASSRLHGNRRVVRFEGVGDRDAAEVLRGAQLVATRDAFELDEGAYWTDELLGLPVVTRGGAPAGTLSGVADGPAHDYLVVRAPDGREVLVPAVDALVEVTAERIVVDAVPGLLDAEGDV